MIYQIRGGINLLQMKYMTNLGTPEHIFKVLRITTLPIKHTTQNIIHTHSQMYAHAHTYVSMHT